MHRTSSTRRSVGTTGSTGARGLPRVRRLLVIGLLVSSMLASTAVHANASDHRCGVISAAKWTERGRSGQHWVVSAYHVTAASRKPGRVD